MKNKRKTITKKQGATQGKTQGKNTRKNTHKGTQHRGTKTGGTKRTKKKANKKAKKKSKNKRQKTKKATNKGNTRQQKQKKKKGPSHDPWSNFLCFQFADFSCSTRVQQRRKVVTWRTSRKKFGMLSILHSSEFCPVISKGEVPHCSVGSCSRHIHCEPFTESQPRRT